MLLLMKIFHVCYSDSEGGAARAAYRIHQSLLLAGIDSQFWVFEKKSEDNSVFKLKADSIWHLIKQRLFRRKQVRLKRKWKPALKELYFFGDYGINIVSQLNEADVDLVHLHFIDNVLTIKDIAAIKKPLVWTMHDMWPFCGAEHYSPDHALTRYKQGYAASNVPLGDKGPDLCLEAWQQKVKFWRHIQFTIVSTSTWLNTQVRESVLFKNCRSAVIPYPLDWENSWKPPASLDACRISLNLPLNKKLVLMGADGGIGNYRKGGDLLWSAMELVEHQIPGQVEVIIFGGFKPINSLDTNIKIHWLGPIKDDRLLALYYSAADVMVVPSRQEAFGQTATEALACGTPVAAFAVGGLRDIVKHQTNGWLAEPFDTNDLANGILWMLEHPDRSARLRINARNSIVNTYDPLKIGNQYLQLYQSILASA